jgi:alanine-glyoxylate transaminase/serine-glyoxylate transaminase/serine-pyruvate transaminase
MLKYESGSFMYHTTLPTDAMIQVRNQMLLTREFGMNESKRAQIELGKGMRHILAERSFISVAASGYEAFTFT